MTGSNVYVKYIDDNVTDEELREHFSQCGVITSAKLMRDDKGTSKGFGFVCFSSTEDANKAVDTLNGQMFHCKPLYVAIAQKKEDRRQAQPQLHYAHKMAGLAGPSTPVIPGGYPPLYYTDPSCVVSQVPPRPELMYQPLGMGPGWRGSSFASPARPSFQPSQLPMSNSQRPQMHQIRGRMNDNVSSQASAHSASHIQPPAQPLNPLKDSSNQQASQAKHIPNNCTHEVNKGSSVLSTGTNSLGSVSQEPGVLSSMLSAATTEEQKQNLGEEHKMDNSELLLLLGSLESRAAKADEAVQVLEMAKTKVSNQEISDFPQEGESALKVGLFKFGCSHYRRRCKIKAPCCNEIFGCRYCHNEIKNAEGGDLASRHKVDRHELKEVICYLCDTEQDVKQDCINCGVRMGEYFCSKCNFFDDEVSKQQYHCDGCGICRKGGEKNFFHCNKCGCCYSMSLKDSHNCVENALHQNCPICHEIFFDSTEDIIVLRCGHMIHSECLGEVESNLGFACPVCLKSYCDMTRAWEFLDKEFASFRVPQMNQNEKVCIICNDCGETSEVILYILFTHKCMNCNSYNTRQTGGGSTS